MYDSDQVLQMVGSIGILITALGAVIVNIIVALRTGKKVDESILNQSKMSSQIHEVHTLTNSNLSLVKAELDKALMQIEEMKTFVRDLKGERDKLAITTAHASSSTVTTGHGTKEVLKSIDKNTEETAVNTKKIIVDSKEEIARVKKEEKK